MTQVDAKQGQNQITLLHDILNILSSPVDNETAIVEMLRSLAHAVGSSTVFLLVFEDPHTLLVHGSLSPDHLPDEGHLVSLAGRLAPGLNTDESIDKLFFPALSSVGLSTITFNGRPAGLLGLSFSEAHLINAEVHALVSTFAQAFAVLLRDIKARARHAKLENNQSEFISIVSHDLRSPLTSMKGFAGMLESGSVGDLNDQQLYFVQKILAGISQMTSLVDNIQDAGRYDPETGFYKMQRTQCDPTEIVSRIVKNHLLPAEKQALALSVSIDDNVPIVNVDAHMLERAIINLVDNAIKYTPNGGEVEVGIRRVADDLLISVRDTGLGISPEHQHNLFERRFRIPREEHKRIKGSGLGLFIVRSVARRHGGEAWIESEEGKGSTFFISIPLSAENSIVPGDVSGSGS